MSEGYDTKRKRERGVGAGFGVFMEWRELDSMLVIGLRSNGQISRLD